MDNMHNITTDSYPFISVVMPIHNSKDYFKESIDSVLSQSFKNFELIIVDNCSTDGSWELLKEQYKECKNIKVYRTSHNTGGPASPRNIGIRKSRGRYIAFIDSDDIWKENKLLVQIKYLNNYNIVCSKVDKINDEGATVSVKQKTKDVIINLCDLVKKNSIVTSTVLLSKEVMLDIMFDEDESLHAFEDYHAYMRILSENNALLIGESLAFYRLYDTSLGANFHGIQRLSRSLYCLTKASIANNNYKCLVYGIFRRLISYFKQIISRFFIDD